jgi:hypothetical protein
LRQTIKSLPKKRRSTKLEKEGVPDCEKEFNSNRVEEADI